MKSKQIEVIVIHVIRNFYPLKITYFQFLSNIRAKMKLRGSQRPKTCTMTDNKHSIQAKTTLAIMTHLTSCFDILWGCLCLIPHKYWRYSYYFCFTEALSWELKTYCSSLWIWASTMFIFVLIWVHQIQIRFWINKILSQHCSLWHLL